MVLFWRKGFAATSMNDLCDAMNVRSPSLYAAFGSKEALYLEAIQHYVEIFGPPVWDGLAEGATARAGVESLLLAATETLPESARDASRLHGGAGRRQRRMAGRNCRSSSGKSGWKCWACCGRGWKLASPNGELPPTTDIEGLSRFYFSVYQGMAVQARDGADAAELRGLWRRQCPPGQATGRDKRLIWRESAASGRSIRRYATGKSSESARHCPCGSRS